MQNPQKIVANSTRKNLTTFLSSIDKTISGRKGSTKMVKRKREAATKQHYQMLVSAQKTDPKIFWICFSRAKGKMAPFSNIDPKAFLFHFANLS